MKKAIISLVSILVIGFASMVSAHELFVDVTMSDVLYNEAIDQTNAKVMFVNNTGLNMEHFNLTVVLLKDKKIVGKYTRLITNLPDNFAVSKMYDFQGNVEFSDFIWYVSRLKTQ